MSETPAPKPTRTLKLGWFVFFGSALGVFLLGLLATSINQRRNETWPARLQFMRPIAAWETDNSKWGESFPRQYNSWEATKNIDEKTKYGGSGHRDYLANNPKLVVLWAGYPFAKHFDQARGHYHSVHDVTHTDRLNPNTPGTCWTCKTPDAARFMAEHGPTALYSSNFHDLKEEMRNPIGCADCHNNETMALQISRPALIEAFQRMGKDINEATHQEMRSLVCAQCHVEYYFKGEDNYLTFPWDKGLRIEDMERYYDETGHIDWIHAISGAPMIKMQHPDYEVYMQGIHAYRGVSCADCHMPYKSEGGIKYTDHQIRSPLYNVEAACQVCHKWSERDIIDRVTSIQDKTQEMLGRVETALTFGHLEIGDAVRLGATDAQVGRARKAISRAQMYWDYVAANNGMGFHAPQECSRILGKALDFAHEARREANMLRARFGVTDPIELPDLSSKEQAWTFIQSYVDAQVRLRQTASRQR